MSTMSRNNSVGALQGFSVCQPFLGAALQFYPSLGTQQLDDLINSYLPGPSSIKEKRATVSMDFFEYSQLTGETFKYYPVFTQTSSAESSPMQDSGYGSSFVSPIISDWSWSQSTPSSVPASTPTSVSQETMSCKASKKVASQATKSQTSDFSHLPGMKIMTKDGRDVTNSASRGCKTKEQRDHAHLMRIIKACDACRKKKVRCDPSHKKRTTAQNHTAAPSRLAKKAKTSSTQEAPSFKDRRSQQNISLSSASLLSEPSFAVLEQPDNSVELHESWESLLQFDDEPANFAPFDYDFFFDPEGHLSPQSNQSPATPSMVFSQSQIGHNLIHTAFSSEPFHEEVAVLPPTLPYLDATVSASNYVDFSLYSPEPSFLDEDSALVSDIGSAISKEQDISSQCHGLAQSSPSQRSREVERNKPLPAPDDCLDVEPGTLSSPQIPGTPHVVDQGCHSPSNEGHPNAITRDQYVSQNNINSHTFCSRLSPNLSPTQMVRSSLVSNDLPSSSLSQRPTERVSTNDTVNQSFNAFAERPHRGNAPSAITSGLPSTASVALPSHEHATPATVISAASSAPFSTPTDGLSHNMETITVARGVRSCEAANASTTSEKTSSQVAVVASSDSRGASPSLSSQNLVDERTAVNGVLSAITLTGDCPEFARYSLANLPTAMRLLCILLLGVAIGMAVTWVEALAVTSGFSQFALGLAMYKAYHSDSSLHGLRPQQSRLSTTPKPQGFSDGARLLSCVSTRLRHTHRQNPKTHCRSKPSVKSSILGFAQPLP